MIPIPIKLYKSGNSTVVTIPTPILFKLNLEAGTKATISVDDHNRIVITPERRSV